MHSKVVLSHLPPFILPPTPWLLWQTLVGVCVCFVFVNVCQTRAYGVPSCQHMPGGFSMPVLACTRVCVCVAKARHAAVCGDKGLFPWFPLSSCHPPSFCPYCVSYPFLSITSWKMPFTFQNECCFCFLFLHTAVEGFHVTIFSLIACVKLCGVDWTPIIY